MDDRRLLRQYLQDGSEAAFSRLVERHIKMVYGACRRDLGDAEMAEDATQAVFLLLAEKAATLRPGVQVAGWLFMSARFVCRNVKRHEASRHHYEQEATRLMEQTSTQSAGWQEVEPWINDGLASLSAPDRDVLLLRYFEDLSLAEVASAVKISEPAARQRVSRAVTRLREYLQEKDVAVSSLTLPALLAHHATYAVPAHVAGAIVQSARALLSSSLAPPVSGGVAQMGRGGSLLTKGLFLMSTTKIAVAGVSAVIVLALLSFAIVHKLHAPPPATTSPLTEWQAPAATDPATLAAQQQIQAQLGDWAQGYASSNSSELISVLSPDLAVIWLGNPAINYQQIVEGFQHPHGAKPPPDASATFKINSCSIQGNTAVVGADLLGHGMAPDRHGNTVTYKDTTWALKLTLTNTSGKWLISRMDCISAKSTPYRTITYTPTQARAQFYP